MLDWLAHNPLADLPLSTFVLLYAIVIGMTLLWAWCVVRLADRTRGLPLPAIPSEPDPYEFAYLRGGAREVTHAAICTLIELGYLRVRQTQPSANGSARTMWVSRGYWLERTEHAELVGLAPLEHRLLARLDRLRHVSAIYSMMRSESLPYQERLQRAQLLTGEAAQSGTRPLKVNAALALVGLGAYKVVVSGASEPFAALVVIGMAVAALRLLSRVLRAPRLTDLGERYVQALQLAFGPLKARASQAAQPVPDSTLQLLVGVYGVGVLADPTYLVLIGLYDANRPRDSVAGGAGGCGGGGCGCGGGGSCGGGCGSCGGGCGGCGGGCGGCGGGGCGGG